MKTMLRARDYLPNGVKLLMILNSQKIKYDGSKLQKLNKKYVQILKEFETELERVYDVYESK